MFQWSFFTVLLMLNVRRIHGGNHEIMNVWCSDVICEYSRLNRNEKINIVNRVNEFRNQVAGAGSQMFPYCVGNIHHLVWDEELAKKAQNIVNTCPLIKPYINSKYLKTSPDQLKIPSVTMHFLRQNYEFNGDKDGFDVVTLSELSPMNRDNPSEGYLSAKESILEYISKGQLNDFWHIQNGNKNVRNMVFRRSEATRIGCGYLLRLDKSNRYFPLKSYLTCLYGSYNMTLPYVYEPPCSGCLMDDMIGRNNKNEYAILYSHLCYSADSNDVVAEENIVDDSNTTYLCVMMIRNETIRQNRQQQHHLADKVNSSLKNIYIEEKPRKTNVSPADSPIFDGNKNWSTSNRLRSSHLFSTVDCNESDDLLFNWLTSSIAKSDTSDELTGDNLKQVKDSKLALSKHQTIRTHSSSTSAERDTVFLQKTLEDVASNVTKSTRVLSSVRSTPYKITSKFNGNSNPLQSEEKTNRTRPHYRNSNEADDLSFRVTEHPTEPSSDTAKKFPSNRPLTELIDDKTSCSPFEPDEVSTPSTDTSPRTEQVTRFGITASTIQTAQSGANDEATLPTRAHHSLIDNNLLRVVNRTAEVEHSLNNNNKPNIRSIPSDSMNKQKRGEKRLTKTTKPKYIDIMDTLGYYSWPLDEETVLINDDSLEYATAKSAYANPDIGENAANNNNETIACKNATSDYETITSLYQTVTDSSLDDYTIIVHETSVVRKTSIIFVTRKTTPAVIYEKAVAVDEQAILAHKATQTKVNTEATHTKGSVGSVWTSFEATTSVDKLTRTGQEMKHSYYNIAEENNEATAAFETLTFAYRRTSARQETKTVYEEETVASMSETTTASIEYIQPFSITTGTADPHFPINTLSSRYRSNGRTTCICITTSTQKLSSNINWTHVTATYPTVKRPYSTVMENVDYCPTRSCPILKCSSSRTSPNNHVRIAVGLQETQHATFSVCPALTCAVITTTECPTRAPCPSVTCLTHTTTSCEPSTMCPSVTCPSITTNTCPNKPQCPSIICPTYTTKCCPPLEPCPSVICPTTTTITCPTQTPCPSLICPTQTTKCCPTFTCSIESCPTTMTTTCPTREPCPSISCPTHTTKCCPTFTACPTVTCPIITVSPCPTQPPCPSLICPKYTTITCPPHLPCPTVTCPTPEPVACPEQPQCPTVICPTYDVYSCPPFPPCPTLICPIAEKISCPPQPPCPTVLCPTYTPRICSTFTPCPAITCPTRSTFSCPPRPPCPTLICPSCSPYTCPTFTQCSLVTCPTTQLVTCPTIAPCPTVICPTYPPYVCPTFEPCPIMTCPTTETLRCPTPPPCPTIICPTYGTTTCCPSLPTCPLMTCPTMTTEKCPTRPPCPTIICPTPVTNTCPTFTPCPMLTCPTTTTIACPTRAPCPTVLCPTHTTCPCSTFAPCPSLTCPTITTTTCPTKPPCATIICPIHSPGSCPTHAQCPTITCVNTEKVTCPTRPPCATIIYPTDSP